MNLLTFAYLGEAQEFIKMNGCKPVLSISKYAYNNEKDLLLITGEGIESTTVRMKIVFEKYNNQISKVINIGISGALDESLELKSVHRIRNVFKENSNESYSTEDINSTLDCITANNRVLDTEYARKLLPLAPIVDRELWACAKICHEFNVPFRSFKLISDYAGKTSDTAGILSNAKEYSEKLFEYYCGEF